MKEKRVFILYFIASFVYICAVVNFIDGNTSIAIIYLYLVSTYLCLESISLSKNNKK